MTADSTARAQAQMHLIGARALTSNLHRVDELTVLVSLAASEGALDTSAHQAGLSLAHQLAGSAGTFGFEKVSELARRVEGFLAEQSFADQERCAAAARDLALMRAGLLAGPDVEDDELS